MNTKDIVNVTKIIQEKADLNKLVVFVGAGVSRNVPGMPSWNELVCNMAKSIGYSKCSSCHHRDTCSKTCPASEEFSSDDFLKIPQYVYNQKRNLYEETLLRNITSAPMTNAPLSEAIFNLQPDHIITTNYDRLLESSTCIPRSLYDVVVTDKDLLDSQKSKYIIKMHGDIDNIKSIVLKEQDYLNYSRTHVLIELFIRSLIVDHIVLFLGYSLNDINVKQIISWINYIRSQNASITRSRYIGYIVLDEPSIDRNTLTYFSKNNIRVININDMPLVNNLPKELNNIKGQRLFSFLKSIYDPMQKLESFPTQTIENIIDSLYDCQVYDYRFILSKLYISSYELYDTTLLLYKDTDYDKLYKFIHSHSKRIDTLLQLFSNAGINKIHTNNSHISENTIIIKTQNTLYNDSLYSAYIQNNYIKLDELCKVEKDINKKLFFKHFIYGYNQQTVNDMESNHGNESINGELIYLFNKNVLKAQTTFFFSVSEIKHYINSIASSERKEAYQYYINICEGNKSLISEARKHLEILKTHVNNNSTIYFAPRGTISDLYKIKNIVCTQYLFFYNNNLFSLGLSDVKSLYDIYTEGIICANSDKLDLKYTPQGIETTNEKYSLTPIDIDIISKYTSSKDLLSYISEYNISSLCLSPDTTDHVVTIFTNLSHSFQSIQAYGYHSSNIDVLCNLALLLLKTHISESNKTSIAIIIEQLFSDNVFNQHLWNYPGNKEYLYIFAILCKSLSPKYNISCIQSIVSSSSFFNTILHSPIGNARDIIEYFLPEQLSNTYEKLLAEIINNQPDTNKKIGLLRLFYRRIYSAKEKKKYTLLLSESFKDLDSSSIYDFVLSKWYKPSDIVIDTLLADFHDLKSKQVTGVTLIPDPIKSKLECIYILYLSGYINNIHLLDEYESEYPHLHFLLHPESFNYSLVDFSDYMWVNFAAHRKYMKYFMKNKDIIIPKLTERIKNKNATEDEKKILYGFFLAQSKDIWFI